MLLLVGVRWSATTESPKKSLVMQMCYAIFLEWIYLSFSNSSWLIWSQVGDVTMNLGWRVSHHTLANCRFLNSSPRHLPFNKHEETCTTIFHDFRPQPLLFKECIPPPGELTFCCWNLDNHLDSSCQVWLWSSSNLYIEIKLVTRYESAHMQVMFDSRK